MTIEIQDEMVEKIKATLEQLSFFSKQTSPSECERIVRSLKELIKELSVEVESEEKELQAETHGGQEFNEVEYERMNEYGCRRELVQKLEKALEMVYHERPEFRR